MFQIGLMYIETCMMKSEGTFCFLIWYYDFYGAHFVVWTYSIGPDKRDTYKINVLCCFTWETGRGGGGMWEKSAKFLAYTPQDRWTLFEVGLFVTDSNAQL